MIEEYTDDELLKSRLIISHGLPGSGKTEWAKSLAGKNSNIVIVDRDEILMNTAQRKRRRDQYSAREQKRALEIQKNIILDAFSKGKTVITTEPNLDHRFLATVANFAREAGHSYSQKYFDVPIEECKRRNRLRADELGEWTTDEVVDSAAATGYGVDGRIKAFRIGSELTLAYDRVGTDGERFLEDFNKRMLEKNPPQGRLLANFDADGTLVDTRSISDRYMSVKPRMFKEFQTSSEFAPPNELVLEAALKAHSAGLTISVTTARTDEYAELTANWLEKNGVPVTYLRMRKLLDPRPDYEVKVDMISEFEKEGLKIVHSWDDNPAAVRAFIEAGIPVTRVPFHEPVLTHEEVEYPRIEIASPFVQGSCIRCGKPFKGEGFLGPSCRLK